MSDNEQPSPEINPKAPIAEPFVFPAFISIPSILMKCTNCSVIYWKPCDIISYTIQLTGTKACPNCGNATTTGPSDPYMVSRVTYTP